MTGRNHILLSAVASAMFATVCIFPYVTVASNRLSGKHVYKHPKLGFSLEYSALLTARDFPDGVVLENFLENNEIQIYDRVDIQVTNRPFQEGYTKGPVETFKSLRNAKAGEIVKVTESATHTKIENLKVNGYPAVRVVCEDKPTGGPLLAYYSVSVYIKKGTEIWEVMSQGIDKKTQEKGAKTVEEILRTLKLA